MITFVDKVENAINCLKSVKKGLNYLPTAGMIVEEKLDKETRRVYTRELHKEGKESSHEHLFKFLSIEKAAAHSRKNTEVEKPKVKNNKDEEDASEKEKVKTHSTGAHQEGRGGGAGRGRGRGGFNRSSRGRGDGRGG